LIPKLLKLNISIIHQCGKNQYKELKKFYHTNNLQVELYDFINDMPSLLKKADFAISRSGASTLWELCASQVPSIFIPYPYATGDHQYYNAKFLKDKNLAFIFRENKIQTQKILTLLQTVDLKKISSSLSATIHPNGAKKIIDFILLK
jgi:UDP-N-acetylglucosamine--N-acetylmuramyl-(pentapeptide) pyrophosphoryl-undecaprenol N-acetylglucosamine transferase